MTSLLNTFKTQGSFAMKKIFYLSCCSVFCLSLVSFSVSANNDANNLLFDNTTKQSPETDGKNDLSFFDKIKKLVSFEDAQNHKQAESIKKETPEQKKLRLAQEGDVDAQLFLAYSYLYGANNFPSDQKQALKFYSLAAMQGNAVALNNLGSLLFNGSAGIKDITLSIELFQAASDRGDDSATINLAFLYLTEQYLPKNIDLSLSYMRKSADLGNPIAKYMLGMAYLKGVGLPKNEKLAFSLILSSAKAGYDSAQIQVAQMYFNGIGTTQNYVLTKECLLAAAKQGNVTAMVMLADLFTSGQAFEKDPLSAHAWYNIASVSGRPDAGEKREETTQFLKKEDVLIAQENAARFVAAPTDVTKHAVSTFGENLDLLLTAP